MLLINVIKVELRHLIDYINVKKSWDLEYDDYIGSIELYSEIRCIGRVWDASTWDINKQCGNKVSTNVLCNSCWKRTSKTGLVTEYPDEVNVLIHYRKGLQRIKEKLKEPDIEGYSLIKNRNIDSEIDLKKYIKTIPRKKTHKKISNKKDKYMFTNSLDIVQDILVESPGVGDIKTTIDTRNIYDDWWNSGLVDKIKIYDNDNGTSHIFALDDDVSGQNILNKNQVILGKYRIWADSSDEIVDYYKNNENNVLDPQTAVPLFEYELYKDSSLFHDLTPKIYREYRYDIDKQELHFTNSIELI